LKDPLIVVIREELTDFLQLSPKLILSFILRLHNVIKRDTRWLVQFLPYGMPICHHINHIMLDCDFREV